jgi:hypothetical protein
MDPKPYTDALHLAFESFSSNTPATAFSVFALVLLIIGLVLALVPIKTEAKFSRWYAILMASSLAIGMLCALIGPGLAILDSRTTIAKVTRHESLSNLKDNRRVSWLIRLIVYNPLQPDEANKLISVEETDFRLGDVPNLGKLPQRFSFVADYEELRGYNVMDAVRMVGGEIKDFQYVLAIIFPVGLIDDHLYPADARGLLQVVDRIQSEDKNSGDPKIHNPYPIHKKINDPEYHDLNDFDIQTWAWGSYQKFYHHYCEMALEFRDGKYDTRDYIGTIMSDWNPLGFSRIKTQSPEQKETPVCQIKDWDDVMRQYSGSFGARSFLLKNFDVKRIVGRYLLHFNTPNRQVIPDIWNDRHVVKPTESFE